MHSPAYVNYINCIHSEKKCIVDDCIFLIDAIFTNLFHILDQSLQQMQKFKKSCLY